MARRTGADAVYAVADRWRTECLTADGSLGLGASWEPQAVDRLLHLVRAVTDRKGFLDELRNRLADEPELALLAAEAAVVYYLFVWEGAIGPRGKRKAVDALLALAGQQLPADGDVASALHGRGVGHPGQYFVAHPQPQLALVLELAQRVKQAPDRAATVADPWALRDLADEVADSSASSMRHIVLHLLHPASFERISSADHKRQILDTYAALLDPPASDDDEAADVDRRLLHLRERLAALLARPADDVDYYDPPLKGTWGATSESTGDLVSALDLKRQVVLYGPPGTGKTHEAKLLAERIVRRAAMRRHGPAAYLQREAEVAAAVARQVRRLQLHPAYSYEEFVRGQRLAEGGGVRYEDGYLLRLVGEIEETAGPDALPWVLVLDEMNRADLSRVLGEAFSVLEDRGSEVELPGVEPGAAPRRLRLPEQLYVIGTMNLIDQSLEQVDFALRRRFLWHRSGYDALRLREVLAERWQAAAGVDRYRWDRTERLQEDVEEFVDRCTALNAAVAASPLLGEDYEVGHTYFFDVVGLLARAEHLHRKQRARHFLFKGGKALPPVEALWEMSLRPLLEQYLQGVDAAARRGELDRLGGVLLAGAAE